MAVERNPRPPVLDLSRPAGAVQMEIDVSEAAEVLMSISALGDRAGYDTYDLGAEWLNARRETIPPDLLAAVDELMLGSGKVSAHLLGLVLETPTPRTFAAFLDHLEAADPLEIKLHVMGRFTGASSHLPPAEVIERAARGDEEAKEAFLAPLFEYSDKHAKSRDLLDLHEDELKRRLVDLLPRWYELVFLPHEQEWRAAAERDAEAKRTLAPSRSPEQLIELATRGYQYTPAPDIRRVVLFPSWWMRPWVILWEHKGAKIFAYPIPEPAEGGASRAEVARVYKALGDEGRLKLLRRLSDGPLRLSEAAAELGVAKSTAHHHLAILRHAGFVTMRDEDEKVYNLRHDLLPRAGELLGDYLGSSRSSATSP